MFSKRAERPVLGLAQNAFAIANAFEVIIP